MVLHAPVGAAAVAALLLTAVPQSPPVRLPATVELSPGVAAPAAGTSSSTQIMLREHDCQATGLPDEIPASAVIRTATGDPRWVSFDRGWAAYEGTSPGDLVAVCHEVWPG